MNHLIVLFFENVFSCETLVDILNKFIQKVFELPQKRTKSWCLIPVKPGFKILAVV